MLGSWAGPRGGRAFAGPGGCPALALLAPPRFEPWARLSARALPPARSCSRFGCSGFPRRGGGDRARSDSRLGFPHQCRAAPGGPRRPSLLPSTTFHSHGARGGASPRRGGTRAPSPPPPGPAPLLGNLPPQPAAPRRWRPPSPESCVSSAACSTRSPPPPGRRDGAARFANLQPLPRAPTLLPAPPKRGCSGGRRRLSPRSPSRPWHLCSPFNKISQKPKPQSLDCKARYNNRDGYAGSNPALVRV